MEDAPSPLTASLVKAVKAVLADQRRIHSRLDAADSVHNALHEREDELSRLAGEIGEEMRCLRQELVTDIKDNSELGRQTLAICQETLKTAQQSQVESLKRDENRRADIATLKREVDQVKEDVSKLKRSLPWMAWSAALALLFAVLTAYGVKVFAAEASRPAALYKLVDGDTAWFLVDGQRVKVRVAGIDAPESYGPDCEAERDLAMLANQHIGRALLNAQRLELVGDPARTDRYGRWLGDVLVDGEAWSAIMLREGYAVPWEGKQHDWCN